MATKGSQAKISGDQDLYGDQGVPITDKDFGASEFVSILLSNGRRDLYRKLPNFPPNFLA